MPYCLLEIYSGCFRIQKLKLWKARRVAKAVVAIGAKASVATGMPQALTGAAVAMPSTSLSCSQTQEPTTVAAKPQQRESPFFRGGKVVGSSGCSFVQQR